MAQPTFYRISLVASLMLCVFWGSTAAPARNKPEQNEPAQKQADKKSQEKKKAPAPETSASLAEKIYTADTSQYVGTETCKSCHEDMGTSFDKGPHWKTLNDKHGPQWQGCESCHGPGKAHAESA